MKILRYSYNYEITQYLNKTKEMITGLCDRGLEGLQKIIDLGIINEDNNAIIFLFRNSLSIIDAIAEAAGVPSIENLQLLARSYFEMKCYIEYMVKEDFNDRAISYQVYYIRKKILQYRKIDSDTVEGKEYKKKWEKDITFSSMKKTRYNTKDDIKNIEKQLNREPFKTINEKFDLLKGKYDWFTLGTNKTSFYGLCEYLGYPISYDFFYNQWSELLHGKSAYKDNILIVNGKSGIEAIRSLKNYKTLIDILIPFIMECYINLFKVMLPDYHNRIMRYYKNILKPKLDWFNTINIETFD
jgi:hypothetical protein